MSTRINLDYFLTFSFLDNSYSQGLDTYCVYLNPKEMQLYLEDVNYPKIISKYFICSIIRSLMIVLIKNYERYQIYWYRLLEEHWAIRNLYFKKSQIKLL